MLLARGSGTPPRVAPGSALAEHGQSLCLEGRCKATWKRGLKLSWREADPPNHHDDKVDSDQYHAVGVVEGADREGLGAEAWTDSEA